MAAVMAAAINTVSAAQIITALSAFSVIFPYNIIAFRGIIQRMLRRNKKTIFFLIALILTAFLSGCAIPFPSKIPIPKWPIFLDLFLPRNL